VPPSWWASQRAPAAYKVVHRTKVGKLLACPKTIKASNRCPHRDYRDGTNAGLLQQLLDNSIIGNMRLHHYRNSQSSECMEIQRTEWLPQRSPTIFP